jgi:hypothetical protein
LHYKLAGRGGQQAGESPPQIHQQRRSQHG